MFNEKYEYSYRKEENNSEKDVEIVGVGNYYTALGNYVPSIGFIKVERDF